jgi:hypothetical protein
VTGEVWSEGNHKFRVDIWDNTGKTANGGIDTYYIIVYDKDGVSIFHRAGALPPGTAGTLQGGQIVVHV